VTTDYNTGAKLTAHMDDARTHKIMTRDDGGWVLTRAARELWRTLRDDCRAIPRRAWWRWGITLSIGFVCCAALSYGITKLAHARVDEGLQSWDEQMLLKLATEGPISFPNAILLESPGNLAYLIPLTVTASIIAIRRHRPLIAITIQVSYWLQRPLVLLGWETWNRPRPKLIGDGIAAPGLHSFPSGHAALCVAVYGFLAYLWIRSSRSVAEKLLAVVCVALLTAIVSLARVRLGSHWPSDIIAGAVIGVAWVSVVILAYRNATRALRSMRDSSP
jgi:membrane-associated phospholipid phosphatase